MLLLLKCNFRGILPEDIKKLLSSDKSYVQKNRLIVTAVVVRNLAGISVPILKIPRNYIYQSEKEKSTIFFLTFGVAFGVAWAHLREKLKCDIME